ncbi:MAG: ATP-binding protein [Rudaea sp.]
MSSGARRPLSLQARSLLAAGLVLAAFLGITGLALDRAIHETLLVSLQERLSSYAENYIAKSELSRARRWIPPDVDPDGFISPDSGMYAGVVGPVEADGVPFSSWRSPSALGIADSELPFAGELRPGARIFSQTPVDGAGGKVYVFSMGVAWEHPKGPVPITIHIAEDAANLDAQQNVFRRSLMLYLGGLGIGLLVLLLALVRWIMMPIRRIGSELGRVERGELEQLSTTYPLELQLLAGNINDFIDSERNSLKRYRNTLSDLAHSLKTPLAVVRSQLEMGSEGEEFRWTVLEQVGRMDQIVAYQLSRAATSGHTTFAAPISVEAHAAEIVASLEKVYVAKNILCEFDIEPAARFYGEQGDLLELLGNLLENAFKWANHRVVLTAKTLPVRATRRSGLLLVIEDDGPGIPENLVEHFMKRGVRGDERTQGHGIGLAIVQDMVKAYRGTVSVARSETLGGAAVSVRFGEN